MSSMNGGIVQQIKQPVCRPAALQNKPRLGVGCCASHFLSTPDRCGCTITNQNGSQQTQCYRPATRTTHRLRIRREAVIRGRSSTPTTHPSASAAMWCTIIACNGSVTLWAALRSHRRAPALRVKRLTASTHIAQSGTAMRRRFVMQTLHRRRCTCTTNASPIARQIRAVRISVAPPN